MYVERGYQTDDATVSSSWCSSRSAALLMLGGTLTATFLALSDARPDLATLSAVGASPRTRRARRSGVRRRGGRGRRGAGRRGGLIPGIAIAWPLTRGRGVCTVDGSGELPGHGRGRGPFLDVPWLLVLGLVVVLPAAHRAVVGLTARSRLPLVARLD